MLFNSLTFALFFPIVTTLYFLTPHRWRWLLLLVASSIFYMAFVPVYILILVFTILVDYAAGLLIESSHGRRRRGWLLASLAANIGVLAIFKYYGFIADNLLWLKSSFNVDLTLPPWNIVLPLGLSFHTFQAMAYTIEVYRGRVPAERHLGYYALYVMFYPQLVAGPIERPDHLLPQLRIEQRFEYGRIVAGLKRMALGLFKKVVIADQLARTVDLVYADPTQWTGLALMLAAVFFAWQLYYDFSGYSDVAIGSAQVMGFELTRNFRSPFTSQTLSDFWRRMHISLMSWFRDYVYIPLGGSRTTTPRWCFNLLVAFTISGLWHGAQWTFVLYGTLSGVMVLVGEITRPWRKRMGFARGGWPAAAITFGLFAASLVVFRAPSLADAVHTLTHLHTGLLDDFATIAGGGVIAGLSGLGLVAILSVVGLQLWVDALDNTKDAFVRLAAWPTTARFAVYFVLVYSCLAAGSMRSPQQFIYFQF
mgnify:CR=1 FL=1